MRCISPPFQSTDLLFQDNRLIFHRNAAFSVPLYQLPNRPPPSNTIIRRCRCISPAHRCRPAMRILQRHGKDDEARYDASRAELAVAMLREPCQLASASPIRQPVSHASGLGPASTRRHGREKYIKWQAMLSFSSLAYLLRFQISLREYDLKPLPIPDKASPFAHFAEKPGWTGFRYVSFTAAGRCDRLLWPHISAVTAC